MVMTMHMLVKVAVPMQQLVHSIKVDVTNDCRNEEVEHIVLYGSFCCIWQVCSHAAFPVHTYEGHHHHLPAVLE